MKNDYKVTNHNLVKHFKKFLTMPNNESRRKQFKNYINILATVRTEGQEKYLILRKKYYTEIPSEEMVSNTNHPMSPGSRSLASLNSSDIEAACSPMRPQPPPYREPPQVTSPPTYNPPPPVLMNQLVPASAAPQAIPFLEPATKTHYKDCVDEFQQCMKNFLDSNRVETVEEPPPSLPPRKKSVVSREPSIEQQEKEDQNKENMQEVEIREKKISVKEAMLKFNKYASEEEAKVPSPMGKGLKSPEKPIEEENKRDSSESFQSHPKSKEWMLSAAKADFFSLSKLASDYPGLVKLADFNGYTALHWACKHGDENIVKLIAGTYKADVNARTNGGYTSLHVATQFGRNDIFELLCNVYKADRDILDHSGKKPLDYQKQTATSIASSFGRDYKLMDNIIISNLEKVPIRQNTIKKKNYNRNNRHTVSTGQTRGSHTSLHSHEDEDDLESGNSNSLPLYKRRDQRHNQSFFKKKLKKHNLY